MKNVKILVESRASMENPTKGEMQILVEGRPNRCVEALAMALKESPTFKEYVTMALLLEELTDLPDGSQMSEEEYNRHKN